MTYIASAGGLRILPALRTMPFIKELAGRSV
jgi:hypothetical protein